MTQGGRCHVIAGRGSRVRAARRGDRRLWRSRAQHGGGQTHTQGGEAGAQGGLDLVDVVIARWDRGPQLLISTKAQLSSFGKNLPNRFEESYGDAGNLRGRYPLAAVGYLFVQRATIIDTEPAAFERTIDMIRKLTRRRRHQRLHATALLLIKLDHRHRRRHHPPRSSPTRSPTTSPHPRSSPP